MKLSRKSEYACLAMIDLAKNAAHEGAFVKADDTAQRQKIPPKYLLQILQVLRTAGLVESFRGAQGGYRLAKPTDEVSLAEIVRLMDGPLAPVDSVSQYFYKSTPIEQQPKLLNIFKEIRDYVSVKLEQTTLSDLV